MLIPLYLALFRYSSVLFTQTISITTLSYPFVGLPQLISCFFQPFGKQKKISLIRMQISRIEIFVSFSDKCWFRFSFYYIVDVVLVLVVLVLLVCVDFIFEDVGYEELNLVVVVPATVTKPRLWNHCVLSSRLGYKIEGGCQR